MALGEILRNAREQKGLSPSAVAESTHMLVQVVEDLEREDFRRIAAPIYGRGFIKLYAEFLQLDPEPLIRDFMELFAGARAPAVRTKRVDAPAPQQERAPLTRTVTGPASASPQKQTVQPRPAVRPLSAPQASAPAEEEQPLSVAEVSAPPRAEPRERPAVEGGGAPEEEEAVARARLVVDPEEAYAESDEPDLFRPQAPRRQPVAAEASAGEGGGRLAGDARPASKSKLPIFKIGGRYEERGEPAAQDEAAHDRRRARIESFIAGFKNLKDGVESKLPSSLPRKQALALAGAAAALLMCMAVGIGVLFRMTGSDVKETPGTAVEQVAPPPDQYVD